MINSYVANLIPVKRRTKVTTRNGYPHVYTPTKTLEEEEIVGYAYRGEKYTGAVRLTLHMFKALPKRTPKNIQRERNTSKPDIDNVLKAVMDALNGIAYDDDSQVCEIHVYKHDKTRRAGDSIRFSVEPIDASENI